jgi:predicted RNase H-like HicB family nuclease
MDRGGTVSYTVRAEWDETGWWIITVPGVPGAISQVKRLSQVREDAAEVVEIQTGTQVDPTELKVDWFIHGTAGEVAAQARATRDQVDRLTRSAVRELRRSGFSLRDTGELTGISFQGAQQIEKELCEG